MPLSPHLSIRFVDVPRITAVISEETLDALSHLLLRRSQRHEVDELRSVFPREDAGAVLPSVDAHATWDLLPRLSHSQKRPDAGQVIAKGLPQRGLKGIPPRDELVDLAVRRMV